MGLLTIILTAIFMNNQQISDSKFADSTFQGLIRPSATVGRDGLIELCMSLSWGDPKPEGGGGHQRGLAQSLIT